MIKLIYPVFITATIIASFFYCISCLTPYLSPIDFGMLAFFELGFPYLALLILLLLFIWFFIRKKISVLLLLLLLLGYKNLTSTLAINGASPKNDDIIKGKSLQILTWNVRGFDNPAVSADSPRSNRRLMFDFIKNSGADILCLQEFNEMDAPGVFSNTKDLINLGYPHYYLTNDIRRVFPWGIVVTSSAIFSKIPLQDTGRIMLGDSSYPEYLGYADVMMDQKPLRIFTTHFKSLNLFAKYIDTVSTVIFHGDKEYVYTASKFEKIQVFSEEHSFQAGIAKKAMNNSRWPVLFTGDLNSVPASHAYHIISKGLQDAFLQKGNGLGTTLDSLPPTLRIDYLLADKKMKIVSWKKEIMHASDHYPQQIHIKWEE